MSVVAAALADFSRMGTSICSFKKFDPKALINKNQNLH
jgi:hypothetical protein